MKEYNGARPQNARINIEYTKKKPIVKFSYPVSKKDSKTRGSMFPAIMMIWIIINLPLLFYLGYIEEDFYNWKSIDEYNESNYSQFTEYYTQQERIEHHYNQQNKPFKTFLKELVYGSRYLFLVSLLLIPFLIYFPFKKKWNKLYPDYQAFTASKKYRKFLTEDLKINSEGKYYIELPIFNNIICDFNATKDFSKYLKAFEIEEYKFLYNKLFRLKKKAKKKQKNELIWYARWYFKEKPIKGYLEAIYK